LLHFSQLNPATALRALNERVTHHDVAVTIGEGREIRPRGKITAGYVAIERAETLLERVGVALGVAAGITADTARRFAQQRRIAQQQTVRPVAAAEPELLALFAVPRQRLALTGNLDADAVLAPRRNLRDPEIAS